MISMKKLRFSGCPGIKARFDERPPGDGTILRTPLFA